MKLLPILLIIFFNDFKVFGQCISAEKNNLTLGSNPSHLKLTNTSPYSLMVGFNSNLPTLYIGPSNGLNTVGEVGIGTVKTNGFMLNVSGDVRHDRLVIGGDFIPENCALAVLGKIRCSDLEVSNSSNWPDYVFDENYELLTIDQLHAYINKEKHLPDVPSKSEINTQRLTQSEMNVLLLKKIEELNLYIIELNDQLKILKDQL